MNTEEYRNFTRALTQNLSGDNRVLGLVALGSMAEQDYEPDQWSDHDFFVITYSGEQETFRTWFWWLPNSENITFHFRETEHGLKILYNNGHLLECAVFDPSELNLAKVNRYRVLIDKENIEQRMAAIKDSTTTWASSLKPDDTYAFGQFITNLLVGVGRYRRGEWLSGHKFVKMSALEHLIMLLEKHLPSPDAHTLDNIDRLRRFETAYPEVGSELESLLREKVPEAALGMLELARRELVNKMVGFPVETVEIVRQYITGAY